MTAEQLAHKRSEYAVLCDRLELLYRASPASLVSEVRHVEDQKRALGLEIAAEERRG